MSCHFISYTHTMFKHKNNDTNTSSDFFSNPTMRTVIVNNFFLLRTFTQRVSLPHHLTSPPFATVVPTRRPHTRCNRQLIALHPLRGCF